MDLSFIQHFHFLRPYWLIAFVLLLVILRLFYKREDSLSLWRNVMSDEMLKQLTVRGNSTNWLSPQKLTLLLSFPLCIVLMGPTWQQQPSPFSENNSALIIALDVSQTMEQNDIQPSRLLRAKQKILQLLELRGDTKTALIAYAGSAHIVMPITNDREMIRHFLDVMTPALMPVQGKLPQTILPLTEKLLKATNTPGTVLLIGDGSTSETSDHFRNYFYSQNDQLIVWAMGKSPSNTKEDKHSNHIPLQLTQLESLADNSNGRLVLMTHDDQDIQQVNNYIRHNLIIIEDESTPWYDAGYPLLFVIAFLFLFWFRKGWTLQW